MNSRKKLKELTAENAALPSPAEFRTLQWKKGWPLSLWGLPVYAALRLFGKHPQSFHGICPYFEVGNGWGGLEFGWFFLCARDSDERLKLHELGHGVANAEIGGIRVLCCSIASAARYRYRCIFGANTPYESWWYEGQATALGKAYMEKHNTQTASPPEKTERKVDPL